MVWELKKKIMKKTGLVIKKKIQKPSPGTKRKKLLCAIKKKKQNPGPAQKKDKPGLGKVDIASC